MSTATPATAGQTGPAAPAVTAPPRTVGPPPSALRRTLRYAGHTTRMTVTNIFFMLFTIALPVGMYLLFGMLIGEQDGGQVRGRSEEHTSELQSRGHLVCRLLL